MNQFQQLLARVPDDIMRKAAAMPTDFDNMKCGCPVVNIASVAEGANIRAGFIAAVALEKKFGGTENEWFTLFGMLGDPKMEDTQATLRESTAARAAWHERVQQVQQHPTNSPT